MPTQIEPQSLTTNPMDLSNQPNPPSLANHGDNQGQYKLISRTSNYKIHLLFHIPFYRC